jgi:hypothetical protein
MVVHLSGYLVESEDRGGMSLVEMILNNWLVLVVRLWKEDRDGTKMMLSFVLC